MAGYILKRLGLALLVALAVSIVSFLLLRVSGDPAIAIAGEGARQADIELIRKTYGFDRPLPVQYVDWLGKTLTGELGESIYFKTPAAPLIFSKLKTTMALGLASLAFAFYCLGGASGLPLDYVMTAFEPNYQLRPLDEHTIVTDDHTAAVELARREHKLVLVNFTGFT